MTNKTSIFLTIEEAVQAIRIDFRQYAPQTLLFAGIISLVSDNSIHLKRVSGQNGAWISRPGQHHMQWLDGPKLTQFMCTLITKTHWTPHLAAEVCSRVFQTRTVAVSATKIQDAGIQIETNMENFFCRLCGNCCRTLDYHDELTQADICRWRMQQRNDILQWVDVVNQNTDDQTYRIWVSPKNGKTMETCPFLEKTPTANTWYCRIQETKPDICRQYPNSRKHAVMTGCLGFTHKNK